MFFFSSLKLWQIGSQLSGGFKYFFNVHPYLWKIPILTSIFFRCVGSTTKQRTVQANFAFGIPSMHQTEWLYTRTLDQTFGGGKNKTSPQKTNMSENQWLVQMYFQLKNISLKRGYDMLVWLKPLRWFDEGQEPPSFGIWRWNWMQIPVGP